MAKTKMLSRRQLLETLALTGIGGSIFHRAIAAQAADVTLASIKQAEWITELELTDEQREEILGRVKRHRSQLGALRGVELDVDVPLSIRFEPTSHLPQVDDLDRGAQPTVPVEIKLPKTDEEIAFLPVYQLSRLVQTQKLTSTRLTKIYLERLKRYDDKLKCVVTLTEELALKQAAKADREIQSGVSRGALHGIPWGAKDLIAVEGYPTTWGIPHCKDRELPYTATVAKRLEEAGAVLVAKLSLGALAQGDKWFGGMTRSPWNPEIGSSGSSAGSASATVAGLVGFALGSETLGSILSPSIRCGASSLRPTFGRVSRDGCMPLSWTLDKIGPLCRSIEDCALVFDAIHGADQRDLTAGSYPFQWPSQQSLEGIKVGYSKSRRTKDEDREDLKILKELGCELVELELPNQIPPGALTSIISVEAASVFDEMLRDGHTEGWNTWDEDFRAAQYVSAVDYVRIQRARTLLMKHFDEMMSKVDFLINMSDLVHTNFTGHPSVVMPTGYVDVRERRSPQGNETDGKANDSKTDKNGDSEGEAPQVKRKRVRATVITGHLNADERLLAFANAYQAKLTAHREHPSAQLG